MSFDGKYHDWNQKRIKAIIDFYNYQFIFSKKVLDLGCGHADIGGALYRLGADLTAVDARQPHLQIAGKKFPGIKTVKADLDGNWPFHGKSFDIILDLGLLCHLINIENHLNYVCSSADSFVLETAVCDSDDAQKIVSIPENKNVYDLSANGQANYVSAQYIERVLADCGMEFKRLDSNKLNSGSYKYDWKVTNSNKCDINNRRLWFVVRKASGYKISDDCKLISVPGVVSSKPLIPPKLLHNNIALPSRVLQNTNIPVAPPILAAPPPPDSSTILENKKLKVALCISGHLRTFEQNYQSVYANILSRFDCDVFIHTWDTLGLNHRHLDNLVSTISTHQLMDRINKIYNPKKIVIETNRNFDITPIIKQRSFEHRDVSGILSMYYKIEECNKLKSEYEKENNFKYDCVIRFRGDIFVESPLPIDNKTNFNYLYMPVYGNFGGLNDQFAFGGSEIMDKYSSLYSNIENHLKNNAVMNPEKLLDFHVRALSIPLARFNFKYVIKRSNGLVQDNYLLEKALGFIR